MNTWPLEYWNDSRAIANVLVRTQRSGLGDILARLRTWDEETFLHSCRTATLSGLVARVMGHGQDFVARCYEAGLLHDIGKLHTPLEILQAPRALTPDERAIMQRHVVDSWKMVMKLGRADLAPIVRAHHESLDGSGYPDQLAGERIPLEARIIAVADVHDALTSARPYRAPKSIAESIAVLRAGQEKNWDARIIDALEVAV
jgi:putative nucleotidyltransferase with HDIG domain